jgi:putative alpha-1,2-mannosidase
VLGTPMFDKATLHLAGDRTLVISREGSGGYVQSVSLDGVPYSSSWLPISKVHTGATKLQFTMGDKPNTERGAGVADRPPLFR